MVLKLNELFLGWNYFRAMECSPVCENIVFSKMKEWSRNQIKVLIIVNRKGISNIAKWVQLIKSKFNRWWRNYAHGRHIPPFSMLDLVSFKKIVNGGSGNIFLLLEEGTKVFFEEKGVSTSFIFLFSKQSKWKPWSK